MSDATQLNARREQYLAGRLTRSEYLAHAERDGAGMKPSTAQQAQDELVELRQRRLDRGISEADFVSEVERLGPVAWPSTAA